MSPCPLGGALLSPAPGLTPTPEHSLLAPSLAVTPLCPRPVSLGLLEWDKHCVPSRSVNNVGQKYAPDLSKLLDCEDIGKVSNTGTSSAGLCLTLPLWWKTPHGTLAWWSVSRELGIYALLPWGALLQCSTRTAVYTESGSARFIFSGANFLEKWGTSLAVQWLRLCASVEGGAWVLPLVREIRSHIANSVAKKKSREPGMSHVGKSAPQSHIYKWESIFFADLVELIRPYQLIREHNARKPKLCAP